MNQSIIMLAASVGKRNVTAWRPSVRPSVYLSRQHTHRDSPRGSMRRGQRTFRPDNKEDRHRPTCLDSSLDLVVIIRFTKL